MGYRTIQQSINANHQFDGTAPAGDPVIADDIEAYAAANAGGLFDFKADRTITIQQIQIVFGGQASWKIEIVDVDNTLVTELNGTNETTLSKKAYGLLILRGQKLKLTTANATTAMRARITAQISSR